MYSFPNFKFTMNDGINIKKQKAKPTTLQMLNQQLRELTEEADHHEDLLKQFTEFYNQQQRNKYFGERKQTEEITGSKISPKPDILRQYEQFIIKKSIEDRRNTAERKLPKIQIMLDGNSSKKTKMMIPSRFTRRQQSVLPDQSSINYAALNLNSFHQGRASSFSKQPDSKIHISDDVPFDLPLSVAGINNFDTALLLEDLNQQRLSQLKLESNAIQNSKFVNLHLNSKSN